MLDTDLVAYLTAQATLAGGRVHTGDAPQDTGFPLVVLRRISGSTPRTLNGRMLFSRANYTIDTLGLSYAQALPLANQVRELLDGYRGELGGSTIASVRCLSEPADFSEIDGDLTLRRVAQDFHFVYQAS